MGNGTIQYEQVLVRDNYYVMSGGMHNQRQRVGGGHGQGRGGRNHHVNVAVANTTTRETFHF